jgi:hypothetical protein
VVALGLGRTWTDYFMNNKQDFLVISGKLFTLKTFQFLIQKFVSDSDFLFTFNVYHMADKDDSNLLWSRMNQGHLYFFTKVSIRPEWLITIFFPSHICM